MSKKCPSNKILNTATGKCVLKTGAIGQRLMAEAAAAKNTNKNNSRSSTKPRSNSKKLTCDEKEAILKQMNATSIKNYEEMVQHYRRDLMVARSDIEKYQLRIQELEALLDAANNGQDDSNANGNDNTNSNSDNGNTNDSNNNTPEEPEESEFDIMVNKIKFILLWYFNQTIYKYRKASDEDEKMAASKTMRLFLKFMPLAYHPDRCGDSHDFENSKKLLLSKVPNPDKATNYQGVDQDLVTMFSELDKFQGYRVTPEFCGELFIFINDFLKTKWESFENQTKYM